MDRALPILAFAIVAGSIFTRSPAYAAPASEDVSPLNELSTPAAGPFVIPEFRLTHPGTPAITTTIYEPRSAVLQPSRTPARGPTWAQTHPGEAVLLNIIGHAVLGTPCVLAKASCSNRPYFIQ